MYHVIQKLLHKTNRNTDESGSYPQTNYFLERTRIRTDKQTGNSLRILLLLFLLISSWAGTQFIHANSVNAKQLQEGIAKEIIRFHVIANSDSKEDQELKLKVKDALVKALSPDLQKADSIIKGREIIQDKLSSIETLAEHIIQQNGYSYSVSVALEPSYFPMKVYGDYTFPPGYYEALRVKIGEASGKNWWCVMFPPLCFVDETYSIVDEESQEQLKYLLTEEEYETLKDQKAPVKVRFKLWESVKKLFQDSF